MKPRIFIYVEGGLIQSIISDTDVDIMVLDGDTDGLDGCKKYTNYPDNTEFEAREAWDDTEINKNIVDHYFNQREKK